MRCNLYNSVKLILEYRVRRSLFWMQFFFRLHPNFWQEFHIKQDMHMFFEVNPEGSIRMVLKEILEMVWIHVLDKRTPISGGLSSESLREIFRCPILGIPRNSPAASPKVLFLEVMKTVTSSAKFCSCSSFSLCKYPKIWKKTI